MTHVAARIVALAMAISACVHARNEPELQVATSESAWSAWRAGEAEQALALGLRLANDHATENEGHHVATLAAHALGRYSDTITHYGAISPDYARLRELRGPVFETYLHDGRAADALVFAQTTQMSANAVARAQARIDNPASVVMPRLVELAITSDALSPHMPGVVGRVNDGATVFRFDTGGTYVAMSPALATRYGVRSAQCAQGFANLQATQVCHGVADIELGEVTVLNAPVAVISSLPDEQLGVELGPVLGTNFLQWFLATVDAPHNRIILSKRGDARATRQHLALLGTHRAETPFLLYSDHFILARGGAGDRKDLTFFIDSGLVAVADDGVQAGLLVSQTEASTWAGAPTSTEVGGIAPLDRAIWLGETSRTDQRAMVLPDAAWAAFGTFGGIHVHGLLSYGFLKNFAWTLDFDRRVILLTEPRQAPSGRST